MRADRQAHVTDDPVPPATQAPLHRDAGA